MHELDRLRSDPNSWVTGRAVGRLRADRMATCAYCRFDNRADANFCGSCGRAVASEVQCIACGTTNPAAHQFCDGCGRPTSGRQSAGSSTVARTRVAARALAENVRARLGSFSPCRGAAAVARPSRLASRALCRAVAVARALRLVSLPPWGGVEKASSLSRWGVEGAGAFDQRVVGARVALGAVTGGTRFLQMIAAWSAVGVHG